jgi:DNA-binding PadR family transcriptional regulator
LEGAGLVTGRQVIQHDRPNKRVYEQTSKLTFIRDDAEE